MPAPARSGSNFNPWLALMAEKPDPELVDDPNGQNGQKPQQVPYQAGGFKPAPPMQQPGLAGMLGWTPPQGAAQPAPQMVGPPPPPPTQTPAMAPGYHAAGPNVVKSPGAAGGPPATQPLSPIQAAGSGGSPLDGGPALVPGRAPGGLANVMAGGLNIGNMAPMLKQALTGAGGPLPEVGDTPYLAPMQPTEGRKSEASGELKDTETANRVGAIDDSEYAKAANRVINQPLPGMKLEREDVKNLRAGIAQLVKADQAKSPLSRMNLMPLMKLSDTWFGGDLSSGYSQPQQGRALIAQLTKTLGDQESKLSGHEVDMFKGQMLDKLQSMFGLSMNGGRTSTAGSSAQPGQHGINPLEIMKFNNLLDQQGKKQDRDSSTDAAKAYSGGGKMLSEMKTSFDELDNLIQKYDAGDGGKGVLPGYLPKVNGNDSYKIPGGEMGMALGGALGKLSQSERDDARRFDSLVSAITNSVNNMEFGSRLTEVEVKNAAKQLGTASTSDQLRRGLADFETAMQHDAEARYKGLPSSTGAQKKYQEMGGYQGGDFSHSFGVMGRKTKSAPAATGAAPAADTKTVDDLIQQAKDRAAARGK